MTTITDPDMQPDEDDIQVTCESSGVSPDAARWTSAYRATGNQTSYSVIQGMEQTFGATVGNLDAELQMLGVTNFGVSVATNNGQAYPQIDCKPTGNGIMGTHGCPIQSATGDMWTTYYLFAHVSDLFAASGSSVAQTSAIAAAELVGNGNYGFSLAASQFFVNTTNLTDPTTYQSGDCPEFTMTNYCPMVSEASLSCGLNETASAPAGGEPSDEMNFTLNSVAKPYPGIGTQLGVQTMDGLNGASPNQPIDYCTAMSPNTTLKQILAYAISNGTQFIEVTPDIAADPTCWPAMKSALNSLASQMQTNCLY